MIWQFKISVEKDVAYGLSEALEKHADVMSLFESPNDQTLWVVEGTCEQEPNRDRIEGIIKDFKNDPLPSLDIIKLPDIDWLAENRKSFPPLEIAGFYIYGSHIKDPQWGANIPLKIDASTAFGTGNHGTTHGCLEALQRLKSQGIHPRNPLDLGCGTGILALGIAKLFQVKTLALDIDPDATEKALYNAKENDAAELITVLTSGSLEGEDITQKEPFDLIVANILAGPLIEMAFQVKKALTKGGSLILSGILYHQVKAVKAAYVDATLTLQEERLKGEWATLIFTKQSIQDALKSRMDFSIQIEG